MNIAVKCLAPLPSPSYGQFLPLFEKTCFTVQKNDYFFYGHRVNPPSHFDHTPLTTPPNLNYGLFTPLFLKPFKPFKMNFKGEKISTF